MEPTTVITKAIASDAEALSNIKLAIWLDTYLNEELNITAEDIYAKDFLCKERIATRAAHMEVDDGINYTLVARIDTQIVGYGRVTRGDVFDEVATLYVLPQWQGMKIGTRLMRQLLSWLGDDHVVKVGVVLYNKKAIKFYQKFNFKLGEIVNHDNPVFPSGKDLPEVEMIRTPN